MSNPTTEKMTNIHDYLEAIGAEPPTVDEQKLAEAKASVIWVDSIEEAVNVIERLDEHE